MAVMQISPIRYGRLLTRILPKVIETDAEFERYVEQMAALDRKAAVRGLSPEEETLLALLERLVQDYDEKIEIPETPPHKMVRFLMEQHGLRQADFVLVLGSRAQVSDTLNARRGISKAQAKKLAAFFGISAELFI